MMESQFSPQLVEEHLGMLQRRNIDGVVLFGFTGIKEEMLKPWQPSLVLLARDAHGFASVCYDDEGAIITLMQRLYDAAIATSASSAYRTRRHHRQAPP
jgi:LacI family trehalose operon transcriptional repressor